MRKHFLLLMLMTLLPLAGFAQSAVGQQFNSGNYRYQVTKVMVGTTPGEVTMIDRREGRAESAFVDADGKLDFPESITVTYEDEVYNFNVAAILAPAMQNHATATSVEIPARLKEIPANCFNGCSNLTSITFQTGSQITTIGVGAFATTRIANFDFSPCTKLLELPNGVFAEAGNLTNSYIKTITLPGGTQFKHINGALQYLTELTTINNLENSNLQELIAESFKDCAQTLIAQNGYQMGDLPQQSVRTQQPSQEYLDELGLNGNEQPQEEQVEEPVDEPTGEDEPQDNADDEETEDVEDNEEVESEENNENTEE